MELEEEEEIIVEYMDSDEDVKKRRKKKSLMEDREPPSAVEVDQEEEEEEYSPTPMQQWVPAEPPPALATLRFQPAEFPSARQVRAEQQQRSTVLGRYGRSVIIAAPPEELPPHKGLCSSALMVSADQLQAHLAQQANRFRSAGKAPPGGGVGGSRWRTEYELKAAVTPWVGNLVIPSRSRRRTADELREQAQRRALSSTPVFLFFLQTMKVDSVGCKEMIRRREQAEMSPPPPDVSPQLKDPRTLAGMLQRRRHQEQHQKLSHPVPAVPPPALMMPPQRNPAWCPQAVFVPQPSVASFQVLCPAFVPPPAPNVIMAFPLPAPPRWTAPPAPAWSASVQLRPSAGAPGPAFSAPPPPASALGCLRPSTTTPLLCFYDHDYATPPIDPTGRSRRGEEEPELRSSVQPASEDGSGAAVAVEGRRLRKPSQKARAFQEAARAKVSSEEEVLDYRVLLLNHPFACVSRLKPSGGGNVLLLAGSPQPDCCQRGRGEGPARLCGS